MLNQWLVYRLICLYRAQNNRSFCPLAIKAHVKHFTFVFTSHWFLILNWSIKLWRPVKSTLSVVGVLGLSHLTGIYACFVHCAASASPFLPQWPIKKKKKKRNTPHFAGLSSFVCFYFPRFAPTALNAWQNHPFSPNSEVTPNTSLLISWSGRNNLISCKSIGVAVKFLNTSFTSNAPESLWPASGRPPSLHPRTEEDVHIWSKLVEEAQVFLELPRHWTSGLSQVKQKWTHGRHGAVIQITERHFLGFKLGSDSRCLFFWAIWQQEKVQQRSALNNGYCCAC